MFVFADHYPSLNGISSGGRGGVSKQCSAAARASFIDPPLSGRDKLLGTHTQRESISGQKIRNSPDISSSFSLTPSN